MKRRYCECCDDVTNANPCAACGADTVPWPVDGSETDRFYQDRAGFRGGERAAFDRETSARVQRELKR